MTERLSRRDRHALAFALDCLRGDDRGAALYTLAAGGPAAWALARSARGAWDHVSPRILRARLALLLRVLLRADAGDYGRLRCSCGRPTHVESNDDLAGTSSYWCRCSMPPWKYCGAWPRRVVRPLWELAPSHEGSR